jgi:hypothetical protein
MYVNQEGKRKGKCPARKGVVGDTRPFLVGIGQPSGSFNAFRNKTLPSR